VGFILRYIAPLPLRHEIADHEAKEALVSASDLDWTIARPPKLANGRRSAYRVGEDITTWGASPDTVARERCSFHRARAGAARLYPQGSALAAIGIAAAVARPRVTARPAD
jgi:hypothetical protein